MEVWSFEIHQGFFYGYGKGPGAGKLVKKCVNKGENLLSDI